MAKRKYIKKTNVKEPEPISETVSDVLTETPKGQCSRCGSEKFIVMGQLPSTEYSGVIDGKAFKRVDRFRIHCEGCEQYSVLFVRS